MQWQAHCLGIYHVDYIAIKWKSHLSSARVGRKISCNMASHCVKTEDAHMSGYWVILIWLECNSLSSGCADFPPLFVMHLPSPSACSWAGTQVVTPLFFHFIFCPFLLFSHFFFCFLLLQINLIFLNFKTLQILKTIFDKS